MPNGWGIESIDIHSSVAVYIQIENHIQFAIASGKLRATDQLPSVRELAERLGVNVNTVAKAYRDLEVMGLLYTRRGMGVFINKGVEAQNRKDVRKRILAKIEEVVREAKAAGLGKSEIKEAVDVTYSLASPLYSEPSRKILDLARRGTKRGRK